MLRGCLLWLAVLAALVGGYFYWLDGVFEEPGNWIGAGIVGFVVICCLGVLTNAVTAWRDWSRASMARFDVQLVDGATIAVSGPIHPVGDALLAPFSGSPCVLCEYDLASPSRASRSGDDSNSGSDYAGFLMVPCAVHSPVGEVRILGFPLVEGFGEARCDSYAAAQNARRFLESHTFEDRAGVKIVSVLSVFGEIWCDDDGLVEKNMRLSNVSLDELFPSDLNADLASLQQAERSGPTGGADRDQDEESQHEHDDENVGGEGGEDEDDDDLNDGDRDDGELDDGELTLTAMFPKLVEKRVPVGEAVCVIGRYDQSRGGLVPAGRGGSPNRLLRGTAEQIVERSRASFYRRLLGGLIGLVVVHGILLGIIWLYRHSPEVIRDRHHQAVQAVVHGQVDTLATLVRRGLDVNDRGSEPRPLLMMALDAPTAALLIQQGADVDAVDNDGATALTLAARHGRTEVVRELVAAGARLDPRSHSTGRTPLGEAVHHGRVEVAGILREAGATE